MKPQIQIHDSAPIVKLLPAPAPEKIKYQLDINAVLELPTRSGIIAFSKYGAPFDLPPRTASRLSKRLEVARKAREEKEAKVK